MSLVRAEAPTPGGAFTPAWRSPRAWAVLLVLTVAAIAIDLGSKSVAFARIADAPVVVNRQDVLALKAQDPSLINQLIPRHEPVVAVSGLLNFTLVLNPGAVFGTGAGGRWFFVGFTIIALPLALSLFAFMTRPRDHLIHGAVAILIGGGVGNLYDRLVYACVRDFLHPLPNLRWPFGDRGPVWPYVSNVADAFLLVGIAVLAIYILRAPSSGVPEPVVNSSTPTTPTGSAAS